MGAHVTDPQPTPTQWVDEPPPSARATRAEVDAFAAELRARPCAWAVYRREFGSVESARVYAWRIREGRTYFGDGFDAEAREDSDGATRVYVRYVPTEQPPG